MRDMGVPKIVFDGAAERCSQYAHAARVLVSQAAAMHGVDSGTSLHVVGSQKYPDGVVIDVTIPIKGPAVVTIHAPPEDPEEKAEPEEQLYPDPFVAAYGILGPQSSSTDGSIGNELTDHARNNLPEPSNPNFRLLFHDEEVVEGIAEPKIVDMFVGDTNKLVEYITSEGSPPEIGLTEESLMSDGFEGPLGTAAYGVWRMVLEYPGLNYRSERVIADGLIEAINAGVASGPSRYRLVGLQPSIEESAGVSGLELAGIPVDYDVETHKTSDWQIMGSFSGSASLPNYRIPAEAQDKFKQFTPYGEWVLAPNDESLTESAGRVNPDGTLRGFSAPWQSEDTPMRLYVRGGWGRVRIDIGIRKELEPKILWPTAPDKIRMYYTVLPVPVESLRYGAITGRMLYAAYDKRLGWDGFDFVVYRKLVKLVDEGVYKLTDKWPFGPYREWNRYSYVSQPREVLRYFKAKAFAFVLSEGPQYMANTLTDIDGFGADTKVKSLSVELRQSSSNFSLYNNVSGWYGTGGSAYIDYDAPGTTWTRGYSWSGEAESHLSMTISFAGADIVIEMGKSLSHSLKETRESYSIAGIGYPMGGIVPQIIASSGADVRDVTSYDLYVKCNGVSAPLGNQDQLTNITPYTPDVYLVKELGDYYVYLDASDVYRLEKKGTTVHREHTGYLIFKVSKLGSTTLLNEMPENHRSVNGDLSKFAAGWDDAADSREA